MHSDNNKKEPNPAGQLCVLKGQSSSVIHEIHRVSSRRLWSSFWPGTLVRKCVVCHVRIHFWFWRNAGGALRYTVLWNMAPGRGMLSEGRGGIKHRREHQLDWNSECLQKSNTSHLFVVGGELYCLQTHTDSLEAVIFGPPLRHSWRIRLGQRSRGSRGRGRAGTKNSKRRVSFSFQCSPTTGKKRKQEVPPWDDSLQWPL